MKALESYRKPKKAIKKRWNKIEGLKGGPYREGFLKEKNDEKKLTAFKKGSPLSPINRKTTKKNWKYREKPSKKRRKKRRKKIENIEKKTKIKNWNTFFFKEKKYIAKASQFIQNEHQHARRIPARTRGHPIFRKGVGESMGRVLCKQVQLWRQRSS